MKRAKLPSILGVYLQDIAILFGVLLTLATCLLVIERYCMKPYFQTQIEERVNETFQGKLDTLKRALVRAEAENVENILQNETFLPEALSKEIIPPDQDLETSCDGISDSRPWAEICKLDEKMIFQKTLVSVDSQLGTLRIIMPAKLSGWAPYRQLVTGVLVSMFVLFILGLLLTLRFRKRIARPMDETLKVLDQVSDRSEFETILRRLPFREIYSVTSTLATRSGELSEAKHKAHLGDIASQVFHDIRAPLKVIEGIAEHSTMTDNEERHLLLGSVKRIEEMTHDLLEEHLQKKRESFFTFLSQPIRAIVREKQLLLQMKPKIKLQMTINSDHEGMAANIDPNDFSRVLSNLLTNAMEALEGRDQGEIIVSLEPIKDISSYARIVISDNGIGIGKDLLERLRQVPQSVGKANGHGMGLRHAQQVLQEAGGWVLIESELGVGTKIILAIPLLSKPAWLEDQLFIPSEGRLVVLDDDECMHALWKARFKDRDIVFLKSAEEFSSDLYPSSDCFYLFDYDLGKKSSMTGFDLIEKYQLQAKAILVTGNDQDLMLQKRVENLGIKIYPKSLLSLSVTLASPKLETKKPSGTSADLVLIDDNELVSGYWKLAAKRKGKKLLHFSEEADFQNEAVKPSTPIYIHMGIKGVRNGLEIARSLYEKGFQELFLTTGDPALNGSNWPFLKGIVDKGFPSL